jgi:hypothetical protein
MAQTFEKLAISSSAVGLTEAIAEGMNHALVTVETESIRFRTDGVAPDATTGHLVTAGNSITLESRREITQFSAIRESADATVQVSYDKYSQIGR